MKRLPQAIFAWAALFMAMALGSSQSRAESNPQLAAILEPIRVKYHLPALAGAIFTPDGVVEMAAVGVRKAGTDIPVTVNDLWHLGSDGKVMTAMLAGTFVARQSKTAEGILIPRASVQPKIDSQRSLALFEDTP